MMRRWLAGLLVGACLLASGCTTSMTMRFDLAAIARSDELRGLTLAIDGVADARRDGAQIGEIYDYPFLWSVESERQPSAVVRSLMDHMLIARGAEVVGTREHADYFVRIRIVKLDFEADVSWSFYTETDVVLEVALYRSETGELLFQDRFATERVNDGAEPQQLSDSVLHTLDEIIDRIDGETREQRAAGVGRFHGA